MKGYHFALLTTLLVFGLSNAVFAGLFEDTLTKAQQGDAGAQFSLGFMYAKGRGVPENDAEAVTWYRKAAQQGHAVAQYGLGLIRFRMKVTHNNRAQFAAKSAPGIAYTTFRQPLAWAL